MPLFWLKSCSIASSISSLLTENFFKISVSLQDFHFIRSATVPSSKATHIIKKFLQFCFQIQSHLTEPYLTQEFLVLKYQKIQISQIRIMKNTDFFETSFYFHTISSPYYNRYLILSYKI